MLTSSSPHLLPTHPLLQNGGQLPSGLEIVSVQHISIERPSPLHAALGAAARVLHRLSACLWGAPPAGPPPASQDSTSGSTGGGGGLEGPAVLDAGMEGSRSPLQMAAEEALPGSQPAASKGSAVAAGAVLAARAGSDPAGAHPADFEPAAGAASEDLYDFGTIPDELRLPMTAFDEDYMDDPDDLHLPAHPHLPARALKQQQQPVRWAAAFAAHCRTAPGGRQAAG